MPETPVLTVDSPQAYINRELSWLAFARRVLALAEDPSSPLLERVKFAGIMGMLYDEFAMKRIGGLRRRIEQSNDRLSPDGRTPTQELTACRIELRAQVERLSRLIQEELRPRIPRAVPTSDSGSPGRAEPSAASPSHVPPGAV